PGDPRHDQASLLRDQLRRRAESGRVAGDVPEGSDALRDSVDRVEPPRVVRPVAAVVDRGVGTHDHAPSRPPLGALTRIMEGASDEHTESLRGYSCRRN